MTEARHGAGSAAAETAARAATLVAAVARETTGWLQSEIVGLSALFLRQIEGVGRRLVLGACFVVAGGILIGLSR